MKLMNLISADVGTQENWDAALAVEQVLLSNAATLGQNVAIDVDPDSRCLTSLPLLLDRHLPDQCRLPFLVTRLAELKDWSMNAESVSSITEVHISNFQ